MKEIIDRLQGWANAKIPVSPGMWIDESFKLLALYGEAADKLLDIETEVARAKWQYKNSVMKCTNVDAENYVSTLDIYKQMNALKNSISLMDKYILLAKKRATLASDEIKY